MNVYTLPICPLKHVLRVRMCMGVRVCVCGHFRPEMHSGTQCLSLSRARPRGSSSSSLFFAIATIQVQCTLQQVRAAGLLTRTHSPIAKVALATSISVRGTADGGSVLWGKPGTLSGLHHFDDLRTFPMTGTRLCSTERCLQQCRHSAERI